MKASVLMKAIRAKCLDCCCGQSKEVRLCAADRCSLHPYRSGTASGRAEIQLPVQEEAADGPEEDGGPSCSGGTADAPDRGVFLRQAEKLHRDCTRARNCLKTKGASKSLKPDAAGTAC